MSEDLWITSWAKVGDQSPMRFQINDGEGTVDLMIGSHDHGVEVIFTPAALDRLLALGAEASAQAQAVLQVREGK